MALTAEQMIDFFDQQAGLALRGLEKARQTRNSRLAELNCGQGIKSLLMSGLIRWRLGINPSNALAKAIDFQKEAADVVGAAHPPACERVGFIAFLVDQSYATLQTESLNGDQLLDAVLGNALHDQFNTNEWERGIRELETAGSSLAVATYQAYQQLLEAPANEQSDMFRLVADLFEQRKHDEFFSESDQTEGGGQDNGFTVDYRLGALGKKLNIQVDSIHCWRWS